MGMQPKSLRFETQRLRLRPFQDADLEPFAAYRSDPLVAKYQGWDAPFGIDQAASFIQEMKSLIPAIPGTWYQVAIEMKESGTLIGDCAFHILAEDPRQAELGFTLARPFQGKGYATEAVTRLLDYLFEDLDLHRLRAICDVENLASVKLLERLGMRREAHFIENIWFKGKWGDEYVYAILQREWLERRQIQGPLIR